MIKFKQMAAVALLATGLVLSSPVWSLNYTFTDLGTLGGSYSSAYAINNLGQVVGSSTVYGGTTLWDSGKATSLNPQGENYPSALAINDAGVVAGYTMYTDFATYEFSRLTVWNGGTATVLGPEYGFIQNVDINNAGVVVAGVLPLNSTLWDGTEVTEIDDFSARAINDAGQVAGSTPPPLP